MSVFLIGITGYIGGAVAVALKKAHPDWKYTAYLRSERYQDEVKALGFEIARGEGSLQADSTLLAENVRAADVVINTANADDLDLTKLILDNLKQSQHANPIYIHTSGTGLVCDLPQTGELPPTNTKIYDDNVPEDIKSIGPEQPHRDVDLAIFEAGRSGRFLEYLIAPSTIYGIAHENPGNKQSVQIPTLLRVILKTPKPERVALYSGPGTNVWNNVHILDCADLYVVVIDKAIQDRESNSSSQDPFARFYWASVDTHVWGDVSRALGKILKAQGLTETDEAKSAPPDGPIGDAFTGANSRTVANRGFKDGWKPKGQKLFDSLEEEVTWVVKTDHIKA